MFEGGLGVYSDYFTHAARCCAGPTKARSPNGERLPEYTDARKPQIERQIGSDAPIYPEFEKARTRRRRWRLMRDKLGADHALVKQILAGKTPEARAAELVERDHARRSRRPQGSSSPAGWRR